MIAFDGLPAVDRALFIPDEVWVKERGEGRSWAWVTVSRQDSPQEWARLVAADEAVTTQIKDGVWPSSSSSAPWLMARMLAALRVEPGMRVLEIGTGTGYNAACLAALGCRVTSVEIDATAARQARGALLRAESSGVQVVTGEGALGYAPAAPYDRVISTAAVHTIPHAWVEQCRDGALMVVPYTGTGCKGGMLVLDVSGGAAAGRVEGEATFMPLRGQGHDQRALQAIETWSGLDVTVDAAGQRLRRAGHSPAQA